MYPEGLSGSLLRGEVHAGRIVHSPNAVQGLDAVEEVCEVPRCPESSRFELLARQGGIRCLTQAKSCSVWALFCAVEAANTGQIGVCPGLVKRSQ
jgi:hypothetical protein